MTGRVSRVSGVLVEAVGLGPVAMAEVVALGRRGLAGEVLAVDGDRVRIQAFEDTGGLAVGEPCTASGLPLSADLGPHLLGGVFDGLLRPLLDAPVWLQPQPVTGARDTRWEWRAAVAVGAEASGGSVLGSVPTAGAISYRVLVPPGVGGTVTRVAAPGRFRADEAVAVVGGREIAIGSRWPMRRPRPARERLDSDSPLLTGQRVIDALFPLARGSTAAVPGGFGTGKTMLLQQIAKWCDADVIVYVGCGERGNEMADVLTEFAALTDPRTGRRLAERTVVIANTSNMPMLARETSVIAAATVGELFRDMGYDTVVIADSTSRWAEALREMGSRSGAMPAEEGYPAGLASALAAFYERAGRVVTLGGARASVSIVGAVSPPGGDTTEPVTAHTERFVRQLWSLDRALAYARHYPAVAWSGSFARDADALAGWHARHGDPGWGPRRARAMRLLAEADRLTDLAELVGAGSLPGHQRVTLLGGRLLREGVLQQSATSANDAQCSAAKTAALFDAVLAVVARCDELVDRGITATEVEETDFSPLLRAAADTPPDEVAEIGRRRDTVLGLLDALASDAVTSDAVP